MKKNSKKRGAILPPPPAPRQPSSLPPARAPSPYHIMPSALSPARSMPPAPRRAPARSVPAPAPARSMPPAPTRAPSIPSTPRPPESLTPPIAPLKESPPLFIKIDKYSDVVKNIQRLKSHALSLRDAIDAVADIENELKTGLSLTQKVLDKFNTIITLLDSRLLRVHGAAEKEDAEDAELSAKSPKEIDEYVKNMYEQMERIKHELKTI